MGLRPPRTLPEWSGLAAVAAAAAARSYDSLAAWAGWNPRCAVRVHLGVPCPFCGGTTSARALVEGRFLDAMVASPLVTAMAMFSAGMLVVYLLRLVRGGPPPGPKPLRTQRWSVVAALAVGCASVLYQAVRLGTGAPA